MTLHKDQFELIIPTHTVRFYEEGQHCDDAVQGDFIIVRHKTILADAISAGQELESKLHHNELEGFTWCDHVAFIRGRDENGRLMISEMGPKGYERRPLFDYVDKLYAVIHYDISDEAVAQGVKNDEACSGVDYGWSEYLPLIADGIDNGEFAASWGDAIICSVHTTYVAMGMGLFPSRQANNVMPAHWALWHNARYPVTAA